MRKSLDELFVTFDAQHPEIYTAFKQSAQRIRRYRNHYSARLIFDGLSFNSALDGRDTDAYKINHNYTSFFVRKLIAECPEFAEFFATRKQTWKEKKQRAA